MINIMNATKLQTKTVSLIQVEYISKILQKLKQVWYK